jgi:predicted ferric reductase
MAEQSTGQSPQNIWKVVRVEAENESIVTLWLEGADPKFTARRAGQFATIAIARHDGWSETHPFTLSGAPEDAMLRFTIKREGAFTSGILGLKPGDPVKCLGPLGAFCKDIDQKPNIVMLAGGVGVTPFFSVLRHFRNVKATNMTTLFWATKAMEDTFAAEEIRAMTKELNLSVVHCLSREDEVRRHHDPRYPRIAYEPGRLSADILARRGVEKDEEFYLCGPSPMMDATLDELASFGVDIAKVNREKFAYGKPPGK